MEVKPGYKQTEVGVIPEDWEIQPLSSVAIYTNGKAHEEWIDDFGKYIVVNSKFISTNGEVRKYSDHNLCPASKGQILMVMSDVPNGRAIARCFFVDHDDLYTVNQRICALKPLQIDARLLFYKLNRNPFYLSFDDGVKQTNLRKEEVLACPLSLPPTKAEQEAIAEALSDADALIESLEQLIAKKRRIKQGAMQELLTGKKRLPGFSGEWEVKRFGDIAQPRNERIDPRGTGPHEFCIELEHIGQGTGCLTGYARAETDSSLKCVFQKGDVLFGKLRAYLRKFWMADRGGVCSTEIWVLVAKRSQVISEFLIQLVKLDQFIEVASTAYGTHMPRSDWNVVKNWEIFLPSVEEQTAIAAILSDMDVEIAALEAKLAKVRQLKQGMMQELLTGRIRLI